MEGTLQRLLDLARHDPWLTALISAIVAGVIADLIVHLLKFLAKKEWKLAALVGILTFISVNFLLHTSPKPSLPPRPLDFLSLIGRKYGEPRIQDALSRFGTPEERPLKSVGKELLFEDNGIDFRFDTRDVLAMIVFFSGFPGSASEKLPLGLQFQQTREAAQNQIVASLGRHVEPEWNVGDVDKYELEGFRLYLLYSEFDGEERIREVQVARREVFQQAALGR